jgi:2,4-dienoyl-CoA reductase-like NADH-dependent reductase (Old Yellow Enzyme family)
MNERIADLFSPLTVKSLGLPNRFAMAPMTRRASPGGVPGSDVAAYYARRAAGGVGLIITEGVRISHSASAFPFSIPMIDGADALEGWRAVTSAVHAEGAAIAAQLWHQGAQRGVHPGDSADHAPVSPSGVDVSSSRIGRALDYAQLGAVAHSYADAARNAKAVGFDAVELHGAHGYLLDEFLWGKTNLRTDAYGGALPKRGRFPAEVVAAVREAVGPEFPIVFRFSQWKADHYGAQIATSPVQLEALLAPLVDAGVDILHASTRRHFAPAFPDADPVMTLSGWTKKVTGAPVIAVGSVGLQTEFRSGNPEDPVAPAPIDRLLEHYEAGEFDVIAIGRALLADPQWVNRLRNDELSNFTGYHPETALAGLH